MISLIELRHSWLFIVISAVGADAALADPVADLKIAQLEQQVLELQRENQMQSRRIEVLESAVLQSRTSSRAIEAERVSPRPAESSNLWLTSARWDKIAVGMSEADVVRELGPPTTLRATSVAQAEPKKGRTLFYAMELSAGGFLSGQVVLVDGRVIQIVRPMLR